MNQDQDFQEADGAYIDPTELAIIDSTAASANALGQLCGLLIEKGIVTRDELARAFQCGVTDEDGCLTLSDTISTVLHNSYAGYT